MLPERSSASMISRPEIGSAWVLKAIRALGEVSTLAQGFALLHWLRLGTTAWAAGDEGETSTFRQALDSGADLVFLSAASEDVARVYARIGFHRVGTACLAAPPSG